jgi:hypothetical protein
VAEPEPSSSKLYGSRTSQPARWQAPGYGSLEQRHRRRGASLGRDEVLVGEGDLIGKAAEQPLCQQFRRDRAWLQSWHSGYIAPPPRSRRGRNLETVLRRLTRPHSQFWLAFELRRRVSLSEALWGRLRGELSCRE